jgi:hypothetical protein
MDMLEGNQALRLRASFRAILDTRLVNQAFNFAQTPRAFRPMLHYPATSRTASGGRLRPLAHDRISPPAAGRRTISGC